MVPQLTNSLILEHFACHFCYNFVISVNIFIQSTHQNGDILDLKTPTKVRHNAGKLVEVHIAFISNHFTAKCNLKINKPCFETMELISLKLTSFDIAAFKEYTCFSLVQLLSPVTFLISSVICDEYIPHK